ncbi:MAG: helix-hairpin-helix domain-containing protein [Clostridia bacterium]|nr:helix-hairpin-helix domain-containing protein [Clostridia bacterium]
MDKNKELKIDVEKNLHKYFKNKILELISNKFFCAIIVINIILVLIIIYILFLKDDEFINNSGIQDVESDLVIADTKNDIEEEVIKIKVHITGEVRSSGVYELDEGARISDIIEKAGGITTDADLSKVNLAYQISDGQKIIIPSINQEVDGNYIIENSGENVVQEEKKGKDLKININTATISELITLPGIGNSTAEKIINYRNENGKFKSIEDIKNVSGIGESKYKQLSGYINVK